MATQKLPLNKFRSEYLTVPTLSTIVYGTPDNVATIIVNAQATNTTDSEKTITMWVSRGTLTLPIVYQLPIPAYDARPLVSGRVVLQGRDGDLIVNNDYISIEASAPGLTLSLGWLETVNYQ